MEGDFNYLSEMSILICKLRYWEGAMVIFLLLASCNLTSERNWVIKDYYQITGGDSLKIRDSTRIGTHSRNELLSKLERIDSALSKVDSTRFRIGESECTIKVLGVFEIEEDSTISLKAYYVTINNKKTTNDYFGIYVGDVGTISLKAYERRMVLRLQKLNQRNLSALQDIADSVVLRHVW